MIYTIVSVCHYTVEADSFEDAVDRAMQDDFTMREEEFPRTEGYEE